MPEELKGILVAILKMLHGLGDGKLQIHHAAVAEDHDKEAEPSGCGADLDRAEGAPVRLAAFTRREGELQVRLGF